MPDIVNKVISFIAGDGEAGSDKDILLKQLTKDLSQNQYSKFYRAKQGDVDVSLGQYIFNIYKTVYPLQIFLRDPEKATKIRQITLEAFLDKQVMDVIKRLSPDGIAERKRSAGENLSKLLKDDLAALAAGFDSPRISAADRCYDLIAAMKQFVFFDFCSLLRKFDPEMKEGDFLTPPKFAPVEASIMAGDLSAFYSVLPAFDVEDDWKTVFEIIKYCKGGADVIPLAQWTSLLAELNELRQSKIIELINRLATGNPVLELKAVVPHENLSASFLEQKTREVREVIAGIADNQRNAQIHALEQAVFGALATTRLNFYTVDKGRALVDKDLEGYIYAPALNHLFTFIQEYLSTEIQELCDILLVRGQWTNNAASRLMSDGFHDVMQITGEITKLDETLEEEGSNGPRLRGALLRVDRDKSQARYINSIVETLNEEALSLINRAVPSLIVVGKHFKMLMEDCDKKHFELVMNWKELAGFSKLPFSQRIGAAYKKINYFVQLMLLEARSGEE